MILKDRLQPLRQPGFLVPQLRKKTLPGVADTGPETQSDHPKRPLQVGTDFDLKSQGLKRCRHGRTDIGAISSD